MKIDSASYSLAATHLATSRDESQESLRLWSGGRRPAFEASRSSPTAEVSLSSGARASLVAELQAAMAAVTSAPTPAPAAPAELAAIEDAADAVSNDPFLSLIKSMVEMLAGHPIRIFSAGDLRRSAAPPPQAPPATSAPATRPGATGPGSAGFGVEYDFHAVHEESEQTSVVAQGVIQTKDGQVISFGLELSMTRTYRTETIQSIRAGDAVRKDPLVLNFDGTAAKLSDQRFRFDLDSDGKKENLALLAGGSGYLAIDRDANGRIDSGRELFGPATDSGFGELAALDDDGNGWIDENDAEFRALRVWTPGASGDGRLESLAQRRVGAIALGNVRSPFDLRGEGNRDLGTVAASGVYLTDDGRAGAIQEIDLTI